MLILCSFSCLSSSHINRSHVDPIVETKGMCDSWLKYLATTTETHRVGATVLEERGGSSVERKQTICGSLCSN